MSSKWYLPEADPPLAGMASKKRNVIRCWTHNLCFIIWIFAFSGMTIVFTHILSAETPQKVFDKFILPEGINTEVEKKLGRPKKLEDHPIYVAAAKKKITPELKKEFWLAGFSPARAATGIHDDLWVSVIWIGIGKENILMISLDLIGYLFDEVEAIKKEIHKKFKNEEAGHLSFFIAGTHNHSGPDTIGLWGRTGQESGKNPEYMANVREKILLTIEEARQKRKPARFRFGKTELPELIKDARKPVVKNPLLLSMQAVDEQGNVIFTLVNYAVHAEVLDQKNQLITADFPGFLRNKLEEHFGGVALFFPADIGGMQSPKVWFRSFLTAKKYGEKIAKKVIQSLKNQNFTAIDKFKAKSREVLFPIENQRFLVGIEIGLFGKTTEHIKKENGQLFLPSSISYVTFGPAEFLCVPGELFPELGNEIREKMKSDYKFLIGLCNNEIGYILPEEQWRENGYEESMSLGKSTGKILLHSIKELLPQ